MASLADNPHNGISRHVAASGLVALQLRLGALCLTAISVPLLSQGRSAVAVALAVAALASFVLVLKWDWNPITRASIKPRAVQRSQANEMRPRPLLWHRKNAVAGVNQLSSRFGSPNLGVQTGSSRFRVGVWVAGSSRVCLRRGGGGFCSGRIW